MSDGTDRRIEVHAVVGEPSNSRGTTSTRTFTSGGAAPRGALPARVLSTDATLKRRFALAGLGVTLAFEGHVRDAIARGELVSILEEFCAPGPGYYLDYPQLRHASRALRALIEHLRHWR